MTEINVLIAYYSEDDQNAKQLGNFLKLKSCHVYYITEKIPEKLSSRSIYVKKSQALMIVASLKFQKSIECMEVLNFAKDIKMPIFGFDFSISFIPFGACSAIISGTEHGWIEIYSNNEFDSKMQPVLSSIGKIRTEYSKKAPDPIIDSSRITSPFVTLNFSKNESDVLISYHSETKPISDLISEALEKQNIKYIAEESKNEFTSVKNVKVVLVIMSKGYEENFNCRTLVEIARSMNKKIIPISITRTWKPENWLALITAGKLFYRIFDREQAYSIKYDHDFNPMSSLIEGVIIATFPKVDEDKREKILIESLSKQIEECKIKLGYWPPKTIKIIEKKKPKPVKVVLKEPSAEGEFYITNYTVSRVFQPPRSLYDKYGVPLREKFDCMISYQWDKQALVRQFYMNLYMQHLNVWFDIWGDMVENTNDAMATAIENSRVLLVFLTNKYLSSPNCTLEFKYAISCGKPFIFIIAEKLNNIETWVQEKLDEYPKFEITKIEEAVGEYINGVPKFNVISQAIRDIGMAQPDFELADYSDEVLKLKQDLNSALDEISKLTGVNRFNTCTRCKKQYEENSNNIGDCKKHSAYYLPDSVLMAGKWVCCNQQDKFSVGCVDITHTDKERIWMEDPDYPGCFYFEGEYGNKK